jgi:hypothetical protein
LYYLFVYIHLKRLSNKVINRYFKVFESVFKDKMFRFESKLKKKKEVVFIVSLKSLNSFCLLWYFFSNVYHPCVRSRHMGIFFVNDVFSCLFLDSISEVTSFNQDIFKLWLFFKETGGIITLERVNKCSS